MFLDSKTQYPEDVSFPKLFYKFKVILKNTTELFFGAMQLDHKISLKE